MLMVPLVGSLAFRSLQAVKSTERARYPARASCKNGSAGVKMLERTNIPISVAHPSGEPFKAIRAPSPGMQVNGGHDKGCVEACHHKPLPLTSFCYMDYAWNR